MWRQCYYVTALVLGKHRSRNGIGDMKLKSNLLLQKCLWNSGCMKQMSVVNPILFLQRWYSEICSLSMVWGERHGTMKRPPKAHSAVAVNVLFRVILFALQKDFLTVKITFHIIFQFLLCILNKCL